MTTLTERVALAITQAQQLSTFTPEALLIHRLKQEEEPRGLLAWLAAAPTIATGHVEEVISAGALMLSSYRPAGMSTTDAIAFWREYLTQTTQAPEPPTRTPPTNVPALVNDVTARHYTAPPPREATSPRNTFSRPVSPEELAALRAAYTECRALLTDYCTRTGNGITTLHHSLTTLKVKVSRSALSTLYGPAALAGLEQSPAVIHFRLRRTEDLNTVLRALLGPQALGHDMPAPLLKEKSETEPAPTPTSDLARSYLK